MNGTESSTYDNSVLLCVVVMYVVKVAGLSLPGHRSLLPGSEEEDDRGEGEGVCL